MYGSAVDPMNLPLVPPMDLNSAMPGIDKISPFPLELRSDRSVGLFGTRRRDNGRPHIRMHQGIDLLAPAGTEVFAAATGTVVGSSDTAALILHKAGFWYLTYYQHLKNKVVSYNDQIEAGEKIGEVELNHLHFEVRYLFSGVADPFNDSSYSRENSFPVDPTMLMFSWEERSYRNDDQARKGHVHDNVLIASIEEIRRDRMLRFFRLRMEGHETEIIYPLHGLDDYGREMIRSAKCAFFRQKKVSVLWRDSLFFRWVQAPADFAKILAEIKVYA